MSSRLKKILLLILAAALLTGTGFLQKSLNRDRDTLGLTHVEALTNAPPVLAFTTVALGGFRGLISNMLWIRANDLQEDDKFFEMAQLADWITKLEPHFAQVWVHQAWNMAYNISVKFKDFPDRWRWVRRGIELLRDDGLRYNPNEILIYRELAWFFQHKMGADLDDASRYYKEEWRKEMTDVLGTKPDLDELIHPQTDDQKRRAALLRDKYKMDPEFMKEVDERYGPLEWRLPEAHAIYWAARGLAVAEQNPTKVKKSDFILLRRVIYQSMQLSFMRGRLVDNPMTHELDLAPNLTIISKADSAYEQAIEEDVDNRQNIMNAHRNFLRQAIYFLYVNNRISEAAKWFKVLGEKYPDKTIIDGDPNSFPRNVTLDEYAVSCITTDVNETSHDRVLSAVQGMLVNSYTSLVLDQDDRSAGFKLLAKKIWDTYDSKISGTRHDALKLPALSDMDRDVRNQLLDPEHGLPPEARIVLRTKLGLPAEKAAAAPENAPKQP